MDLDTEQVTQFCMRKSRRSRLYQLQYRSFERALFGETDALMYPQPVRIELWDVGQRIKATRMGIAGKVAKEAKSATVLDVRKDSRYINREIARKEKLCSLLCAPLIFKDSAIPGRKPAQ